jgi:2-polyprenyl-3-methyl-5-hydroxy-6-metoxy-1,4-benzoquinol methylase
MERDRSSERGGRALLPLEARPLYSRTVPEPPAPPAPRAVDEPASAAAAAPGAGDRVFLQRNQPSGVPPLALTGERTLPDVPEENYWFRRHLVVYEWIAARVGGARVIDMATGEGYGADLLASTAASVIGVDANPQAHEHARLRYRRANLRFERDLIESFRAPADVVVCLQTIEHVQDAGALLAHFRSLVEPQGAVYLSTPNVLTLAPKGAARSDNPWHVHEYRAAELRALCREHFGTVDLYGLHHARKLRAHELALRVGWDRVHAALWLSGRFYGAFTPAISSRDFALRPEPRLGARRGSRRAALERALDFVAVCRP